MTDKKAEKKDSAIMLVEDIENQVLNSLPRALKENIGRFQRMLQNEIRQKPLLIKCTKQTLYGGVLTAASLGLEFGPSRLCTLIPRENNRYNPDTGKKEPVLEAEFQLEYRGLRNLYLRNPNIIDVWSEIVYKGDEFREVKGYKHKLVHTPKYPRGEMAGMYSVVAFADGRFRHIYMTKDQIMLHKAKSPSATGKYPQFSPWNNPVSEPRMWKKTGIKQWDGELDWAPELAEMISKDETIGNSYDEREYIDAEYTTSEVSRVNKEQKNKAIENMINNAKTTEVKDA
jgi:phage RecT family recombinase